MEDKKDFNPWESEYKSHQGNVGLGVAISYYTMRGKTILIPLNDTQKYDLVVDDNGLKRVQVKTTKYKTKSGNYAVELHNTGGSTGNYKIRTFDNTSCDILFILTRDMEIYVIPASEIKVKHQLHLNESMEKWKCTQVV